MRIRKLTPSQYKRFKNGYRNSVRGTWRYLGPTGMGDWRERHVPKYVPNSHEAHVSRALLLKDADIMEKRHRRLGKLYAKPRGMRC